MNYYKRHIGDYIKDTAHLTLLEHGAYARLMDVYYAREEALPADDLKVTRLVGARDDLEAAAILSVLHEFWQLTDAGWVQSRCEEELQVYREKAQANRDNGNKGGRPKGSGKPSNNPDGSKKKPKGNLPVETQVVPKNNLFPVASSHEPVASSHPEEDAPRTVETQQEPNKNPHGYEDKATGNSPAIEPVGTNPPRARTRPVGVETDDAHERWLEIQAVYPAGSYGVEQFLIGERHARQRVVEGSTWNILRVATEAMAAQKRAQGKIGTEFVWSPANFFGPDKEIPGRFVFQREFKLPASPDKHAAERDQRLTREAAELQALVEGRAVRGLLDYREPGEHESADAYRTALRLEEQDRRARPAGDVGNVVADLAAQKRVAK